MELMARWRPTPKVMGDLIGMPPGTIYKYVKGMRGLIGLNGGLVNFAFKRFSQTHAPLGVRQLNQSTG